MSSNGFHVHGAHDHTVKHQAWLFGFSLAAAAVGTCLSILGWIG